MKKVKHLTLFCMYRILHGKISKNSHVGHRNSRKCNSQLEVLKK